MPAWLDLIVKSSALLLAAAAVVGLMGRASAASRHLVWTGMFAAVLILPIGKLALPALSIAVWPAVVAPPPLLARDIVVVGGDPSGASGETQPTVPAGALTPAADLRPDAEPPRATTWTSTRWTLTIWLAGVAFFLARIAIGAIGVRRWGSRAHRAIDSSVLDRLDRARRVLDVRRPITLLVSPRPWMPVTWGIVRPTILVPSTLVDSLDECPDQFDAVLVHEVAHIARWDAVSQLIARLAVAVWWFNPLFWLAARQARLERERACDDAVLAQGSRASDYAGQLLEFVRALAPAPIAASRTLSMARSSQLERRVRSILDARANRHGRSRASLLLTCALVLGMLPIAAVRLTARTAPAELPEAPRAVISPVAPPRSGARPMIQARTNHVALAAPPQQLQQRQPTRLEALRLLFTDADWRAEMFALLVERARAHLHDAMVKVEIGTAEPIDIAPLQRMLDDLGEAAAADRNQPSPASAADMAAVRERFFAAMRSLQIVETRFANGLVTIGELNDAMRAALDALRVAPTAATVPATGAPMSDTDLIAALRSASAIVSDTVRADTLLALSGRYALSPEMVALYVAAANGIESESERARVFAQPIRIKGGR